MKRIYLILALPFSGTLPLAAQEIDTTMKQYQLQEVQITCSGNCCGCKKDATLNFYRTSGLVTTEDILQRMQGISLVRRGNYGMEPLLRGLGGGQINVTIDGMRLFGACTDKMDPVTIYAEPDNLKNIQNTPGTSGAHMGSTIGGSLNLQLQDATVNAAIPWSGYVRTGYQSAAQAFQQSLSLNYSQEKWAVRVNGTYRKAANYRAGGGTKIPFSQYEKGNLQLSAQYRLSSSRWLKADVLLDDGWNIGFPGLPMDAGYARTRIYGLSYQEVFNNRTLEKIVAKIYTNNIGHFMDDTRRPAVAMHMDMPGYSQTSGAYTEMEFRKDAHQLLIRADAYQHNSHASMTMYPEKESPMYMLTWPHTRREVAGLYANYSWQAHQRLTLGMNGRIDYARTQLTSEMGKQQLHVFNYDVSNVFTQVPLNINGSIAYKLPWQLQASISAGYAQRLPSVSELFGFYLFNRQDGFDYIGNPGLKMEAARNIEAHLTYQHPKWETGITAFYNHIDHYILGQTDEKLSTMTPGARGVRVYENIAYAVLKGIEANIKIRPANNWLLIHISRYTHGSTFEKQPLPLIQPYRSITSVRYQYKTVHVQAEHEYAAHQQRFATYAGEQATPAYHLLHLRGGWQTKLGKHALEINAGVENILNRNYYDHLDWGRIPRQGRNIYSAVQFNF